LETINKGWDPEREKVDYALILKESWQVGLPGEKEKEKIMIKEKNRHNRLDDDYLVTRNGFIVFEEKRSVKYAGGKRGRRGEGMGAETGKEASSGLGEKRGRFKKWVQPKKNQGKRRIPAGKSAGRRGG